MNTGNQTTVPESVRVCDQKKRAVLVLVLDHYVGVAEGLESLRQLGTVAHVTLTVWSPLTAIAADFRERFAMAMGGCGFLEELPVTVDALTLYQGLYVPIASTGLARAMGEGDDRDPLVRTLLIAAFLGIPTAMLDVGLEPNTMAWADAGLGRAATVWPDAWRLQTQFLRRLGVSLLRHPDQVKDWAQHALDGPRVVDTAMVEMWHHQGRREVRVSPRTVVTPQAHDLLRQYGVTLWVSGE